MDVCKGAGQGRERTGVQSGGAARGDAEVEGISTQDALGAGLVQACARIHLAPGQLPVTPRIGAPSAAIQG